MASTRQPKTRERINSKFLQGLSDKQAEDFVLKWKNSREVLLKLRAILEEELQNSYVDEENLEEISLENVARTFGYRRGIRKALRYLPERSERSSEENSPTPDKE